MNDFIYKYWSKTELGQEMIASDSVSDSDLLFLIPNNVKRRYGLPTTRTYGKRKSYIKKDRKRYILSFRLFDLISDMVDAMVPKTWNEEYFGQFVDVKNMQVGDRNTFVFDESKIATIPTSIKPIKLYLEDGGANQWTTQSNQNSNNG